jgi:hypothetical protein
MSKRITIYLLAGLTAAVALAVGAGTALASSAATASATVGTPSVVPIVMADPGCHWFQVAGKKSARLVVDGRTSFKNRDEAALVFAGAGLHQRLAVGKTLAVTKPGTYRITMVGQYRHDNTLVLVVK